MVSPYAFSDDTALLSSVLQQIEHAENFLEIGIGNASNLKKHSHNYTLAVGTDIESLEHMRTMLSEDYEIVVTDRASCFRAGVFDVVAFNPPYLPSDSIIDRTVDGGRSGIEVPLAFLDDALRVSKSICKILLVLSTDGDIDGFRSQCDAKGLKCDIVARKNLFYETLVAFSIEKS